MYDPQPSWHYDKRPEWPSWCSAGPFTFPEGEARHGRRYVVLPAR